MFFPLFFNCFCLFLKNLPHGEYANLACSITLLWSGGIISSPVRFIYLSNFPQDNADIFAVSLLISFCSFSPLILSPVVMVSFYILSTGFFLKHKGLSEAIVVWITKNEYGFAVHFS